MKLFFIVIALLSFSVYSLDDITIPNTFVDSSVIEASDFNDNFEEFRDNINGLNDSLNEKFVRYTDFPDSIINSINIDTIKCGTGSKSLSIKTNDTLRFSIDSTGKVGIGTSSPVKDLDIYDATPEFRLTDSDGGIGQISANNGNIIFESDYANTQSNSFTSFYVDGTEKMRIDNSGNVGVDTTPEYKLHVNGDAKIEGTIIADSVSSSKISLTNITVDSLHSNGGITATTGTFSSNLNADSLKLTKGISATKGNFSSSLNATTGQFSSTVNVDSIYSTKDIDGAINEIATINNAPHAKNFWADTGHFDASGYLAKEIPAPVGGNYRYTAIISFNAEDNNVMWQQIPDSLYCTVGDSLRYYWVPRFNNEKYIAILCLVD